jgi:hypothetical protein
MGRHLSGLKSADFACPIRIVFCLKSPEGSMRAWPHTIMLLVWHKRDYWIIESQRQCHTTDPQTRFVRQALAQLIQLFSLPFDLQSHARTHTRTHTHTHTHTHTAAAAAAARYVTDWHVDAVHLLVSLYENWKPGLLITEQNGKICTEIRTLYPYMTWYSCFFCSLGKGDWISTTVPDNTILYWIKYLHFECVKSFRVLRITECVVSPYKATRLVY